MKIVPLGHATFLLERSDGAVALLDPWFGGYPLLRRVPPALRPDEIARLDLVLVSHHHIDHVDRFSLRLARRRGAALAAPPAVVRRARRRGIPETLSLEPGDTATVRGFRLRATRARHPLCTGPIGFFVEADGTSLYFSGDTRPDADLVEEVRSLAPRVALLQASCAVYLGRPDGMDEAAAAAFARAVAPPVAVPMHLDARGKTPIDLGRFEERLAGSGVRPLRPEPGRPLPL